MRRSRTFSRWPATHAHQSRCGAILVLVAVMLTVLVLLSSYSINVAFMEMTRQEVRIASDSASKAALVALGATTDLADGASDAVDQAIARNAARAAAGNNRIAGDVPNWPDSAFEFGNASKNAQGIFTFTPNQRPFNSTRVTTTVTKPLLIASILPINTYTCSKQSLSMRISHDIILVLDRSGSMAFDQSGNEFVYPPDRAAGTPVQSYFTTPSPTASRWKALHDAVNSFVTVLQTRSLDAQVGVVTYAENFTFGTFSTTEATLDVPLTTNLASVNTCMDYWTGQCLLGDTNIEAGLALAQQEFSSARARSTADRTVILMTDGVATQGNLNIPALALGLRQNSNTVIHTIAFGGQATSGGAQAAMSGAASQGNGNFYNAPTAQQLTAAFQIIADSLPAVYVD